ncbi:MAG: hypothetical protein D6775_00805 [Caldilineae bacterium]|nr:MAG: hypothetical protein D6775_00805 [Caldilineae bacterium]
MFLFSIGRRIRLVVFTAIAAAACLACGTLFLVVLSPRQALEARRIERMPALDAATLASVPSGEAVLVTGRLVDNALLARDRFVAYSLEEWIVAPANHATPDAKPSGSWQKVEFVVPALVLNAGGGTVTTLGTSDVSLSGSLHEETIYSNAYRGAEDVGGKWVPAGSQRYRGFFNGDVITVLGKKASTGEIIPEQLYAGDRVAFVESKREAARGLLTAGLCLIGLAPLVLAGGVLAAVLGRWR